MIYLFQKKGNKQKSYLKVAIYNSMTLAPISYPFHTSKDLYQSGTPDFPSQSQFALSSLFRLCSDSCPSPPPLVPVCTSAVPELIGTVFSWFKLHLMSSTMWRPPFVDSNCCFISCASWSNVLFVPENMRLHLSRHLTNCVIRINGLISALQHLMSISFDWNTCACIPISVAAFI